MMSLNPSIVLILEELYALKDKLAIVIAAMFINIWIITD